WTDRTLEAWLPGALDVGGDEDVPGAADQQIARHAADVAGILAVIAVVAHHEVLPGGDDNRAEVPPGIGHGQELHAATAVVECLGGTCCINMAIRAARFANSPDPGVFSGLLVDEEAVVTQFDDITGEGDQALDQARAIFRRTEGYDV